MTTLEGKTPQQVTVHACVQAVWAGMRSGVCGIESVHVPAVLRCEMRCIKAKSRVAMASSAPWQHKLLMVVRGGREWALARGWRPKRDARELRSVGEQARWMNATGTCTLD